MYQNNNLRNRYQQQWAFLTRRLQRWMRSGDFTRFSREKQQYLRERLQRLYVQMLRYQTAKRLRRALGAAALLLGLGAASNLRAQVNFAAPITNPFGLQSESEIRFDTFADIDGDGDLDIISIVYEDGDYEGGQAFAIRENQGSPTEAQFAAPDQNSIQINLPEIDGNFLNPNVGRFGRRRRPRPHGRKLCLQW